MNEQDIQDLEISNEQAQEMVDLGRAIERLRQNSDFKRVVLEGYFREEAVRLVHLKADPNMASAERQTMLERDIRGIGCFHQYLNNVLRQADMAQRAIEANEQTLEELRAEAAEE